ncbi:MAG: TIGR04086 family membrane protein [bacterium]|nr:TIGR04086 family membrane protein [bacterium]
MDVLKYLKALLYIIIPILVVNIILTVLYYFNIVGTTGINYLKLGMIIISMLIGGIYIGSKAEKKGWLEGIKIGIEVIILLFLISYLGFDKGINIKTVVYYILMITSAMLGSMIGINRRKNENT